MIRSVLVANRGEIAVRIIRACQEAGLQSVAVFAEPDRSAPHVRLADVAIGLGGSTPAESYLDPDRLLHAAQLSGADAVHPGYGFLSENADFAAAVLSHGLVWIGPDPAVIRRLGDKAAARALAAEVGAPLLPGLAQIASAEQIAAFGAEHGFPLVIKAAHGGGGRGLRVVRQADGIAEALSAARREAMVAFGRDECLLERYLERARHVEVQLIADSFGTVVVAGTRDCTLQRRHQKVIEEAPAPFLSESQREQLTESARALFRLVGYVGAGTAEFLVGADGLATFLEVNTRLQVEHPVTEETSGIDLVREQLRIADGHPLSCVSDPTPRGHAIEFRINAEDVSRGFLPSPGVITGYVEPSGPGVRVDSGVMVGFEVGGAFDSLLAKIIVVGPDRAAAIERSRRVLAEMAVDGLPTLLPFLRDVIRDPAFTAEPFTVTTTWIEQEFAAGRWRTQEVPGESAALDETHLVYVGGRPLAVRLPGLAGLPELARRIHSAVADRQMADARDDGAVVVRSPMQGTVARVLVANGDAVAAGEVLAIVEAMKMENPVVAPRPGVVSRLIDPGVVVAQAQVLCEVNAAPA